ncbi:MAG: glycosyltransferase family 39 protein [Methanotrichaceae archaeon]|nr:glycosyltransferase family 39 protein [Methanotrichaceae archaeon]
MEGGKRNELVELGSIFFLALILRLFSGRYSLTANGIQLGGYDEYYHMRRILYTVNHFPHTLWFDSYLNYPKGLTVTWPPLYDQLSATLSLALGQHTQENVELISALIPTVLGALAVVVVYYMIKEVFNRDVALLSAFMAAIAPSHLWRSMFGATDHHSLEVLMILGALLFVVLSLSRRTHRHFFAIGAGVMIAGVAYTWYGAIIYLGIFLLYAAIQMTIDLRKGAVSKDIITTLLMTFGVALILVLPFWNNAWLLLSFYGIMAMIVLTLLMFVIHSIMASRKINWIMFPLIMLVLLIIVVSLSNLPGGPPSIASGYSYLFGGKGMGIAEAEPLLSGVTLPELAFSSMGWDLLFSVAGIVAFIFILQKGNAELRRGQLLILVWSVCVLMLTLGQSRFLYISTIAMGILISVLFFQLIDMLENRMAVRKQKLPKVLAVGLLLLLALPSLAETMYMVKGVPPPIAGDWFDSLAWLEKNSNSTSFYDNPILVPEYSVMSSWDYGNWIVQVAKRPAVANNFQTGWRDSVNFFLSESEESATSILDSRGSKYIIIDYDTFFGKLPVLINWVKENPSEYFRMEEYGSNIAVTPLPKLLNTTIARLYLFDGSSAGHFRLIHESSTFMGSSPAKSKVKIFEYVPGALIRVSTIPDQRVGALLNMTSDQGRSFVYVNSGLPNNGQHEIRVPYSTEGHYGTHALSPYLIFSGNEKGVRMQNVNVSEQDVLEGKVIEVSF